MRTDSNPYRPKPETETEEHLPSHYDSDFRKKDLPGRHQRRSRIRLIYLHIAELLAIGLSFLERSRIARFLAAKASMSMVVEVTYRFGKPAGHRLSSFLAVLVAEPYLIAVLVTGIILIINLIIYLVHFTRIRRRRRRLPPPLS